MSNKIFIFCLTLFLGVSAILTGKLIMLDFNPRTPGSTENIKIDVPQVGEKHLK